MDFLNQTFAQVRDLFHSMTPGARITAGLLLAVVVVSLGFLFRQQVTGGEAYLMGGEPFSAGQLPAMEAAFAKANLSDYELEGNRIRVPRGQQAAYMGALADAGALPQNFGAILQKALEIDSPFMSKTDKLERLKAAKQSELALILRSMQGIENASVIYDVKRRQGLNREEIATASVNVKPLGNEPLAPERIPMIRNLVASAIAGMKRANVTVTDLNGRAYPGGEGVEGGGVGPLEDEYYARKQMVEKDTRQKVMNLLAYIPGVDVQVSAELDTIKSHEEEKSQVDPRVVPTTSETTTESETTRNTSPAGRPGLAAQARPQAGGPGGGGASLSGTSAGRTNESQKETTTERTQNGRFAQHDEDRLQGPHAEEGARHGCRAEQVLRAGVAHQEPARRRRRAPEARRRGAHADRRRRAAGHRKIDSQPGSAREAGRRPLSGRRGDVLSVAARGAAG